MVGKFKVWSTVFSLDTDSDIVFLSFQKKHTVASFEKLYWIQSSNAF